VYQGRWNSTNVVVKVTEHDAARAGEVENEVLLMIGLAHDNIVAAYHYMTYARSSDAPAAGDNHLASGDRGHACAGLRAPADQQRRPQEYQQWPAVHNDETRLGRQEAEGS
jgi:hypothetical protein